MKDQTTRIEQQIQRENKPLFKYLPRLFIYVFRAAGGMCLIFMGLSILLSLLRPVLALIWTRYIDAAQCWSAGQRAAGMAGLLVAYYLLDFVINLLYRYTEGYEEIERMDVVQRNRFQEKVDSRVYKKLGALKSEMFEVPAINDRIERLLKFTQDSWSGLNREVMLKGYYIVSKAISVATIAMSLYILAPGLCWIVLIAPVPTLYTAYVGDKIKQKFVKESATERREARYFEKLMMGQAAKEIKSLGLNDFFYGKWKTIIDRYSAMERHTQMVSALLGAVSSLIGSGTVAAAMLYAIILMTRGVLSLGGLGGAMQLSQTLVGDMGMLMSALGAFAAKKNDAAVFFDVMDLPEQPKSDGQTEEIREIEARNLCYRYPLTEKYVLEDVSLKIRQGEHIALVGENGAGKTTFVRLLSGMVSPSKGELLVNGTPETDMGRARRYDAMASVLQSPARYTTFTVGENVTLGDVKRPVSEEALNHALSAAGFPDADQNAMLGKEIGGTDLSGGQWQKLAIARAHYRDRGFILLDEPTGNLDPLAEAEVFQKYLTLAQGKTLMMVTHRISVASLADRIIVFANGRVAEDGTHQELLARNGEYARLYHEQARWYDRQESVATTA